MTPWTTPSLIVPVTTEADNFTELRNDKQIVVDIHCIYAYDVLSLNNCFPLPPIDLLGENPDIERKVPFPSDPITKTSLSS